MYRSGDESTIQLPAIGVYLHEIRPFKLRT